MRAQLAANEPKFPSPLEGVSSEGLLGKACIS